MLLMPFAIYFLTVSVNPTNRMVSLTCSEYDESIVCSGTISQTFPGFIPAGVSLSLLLSSFTTLSGYHPNPP